MFVSSCQSVPVSSQPTKSGSTTTTTATTTTIYLPRIQVMRNKEMILMNGLNIVLVDNRSIGGGGALNALCQYQQPPNLDLSRPGWI